MDSDKTLNAKQYAVDQSRAKLYPDIASKAKLYGKIHRIILVFDVFFTVAALLLFQLSGLSSRLSEYIYCYYPNYCIKNCIYVALISFFAALLFFPLNYYSHYHLEHRFELSNQNFGQWMWDGVKAFFLNLIFTIVTVEGIYYLLKEFPHTWWVWGTLFYFLLTVVLSRITPTIILPLFYKLKPIEDALLTEKIKILSQNVGAKILGVYQMDMSRKTKKANAVITGIGKTKRIIFGDTLLEHFNHEEIESVLAHELGHYYYRHIWRLIFSGLFFSALGFYIVSIVLGHLVSPLGIHEISNIAGFPIFMLILFLFFLILMPVQNGYSRKLETQADQFSLEQTKNPDAFIHTMQKLAQQNLSDVSPPPLVEFILYSHPSIQNRIRMAENYKNSGLEKKSVELGANRL